MSWNFHDTELEAELRKERDEALEVLTTAQLKIAELERRVAAQRLYIEELEKQLEPSVIEEIRDELDAQQEAAE